LRSHVREKQREARRKIIRQWAKLPKDRQQSEEAISEFAKTAVNDYAQTDLHRKSHPSSRHQPSS
jgi:hypothetical protein